MGATVAILVLYFIVVIAVGLLATRKTKNSAAFHGAQMGLFAIVCASSGEWLGGTATTGVAEYGFLYGMSGAWYTVANGIGVMFLALFFTKLYRSTGCITVPGIVGKFLGQKAKSVSAALLIIAMLAVGVSQMVAAGKLGQSLTGLSFTTCCLSFTVIFIAYTLLGGMQSVASTNTIHLFVMYGGMLFALFFALSLLGGAGSFQSDVGQLNASTGGDFLGMTAIGLPKVSSWIISGLLGACTAQAGIQPVLAAKDVPTAKRACILTALVTAPFGFITAALGIIARILSERGQLLDAGGQVVTDGKLALMALIDQLPSVAGGLTLAAILAAILSTISPIILSAGTMFVKDICRGRTSDAAQLKLSRLSTAAAGVICSLGAILLVDNGAILDLVYSAYALRGTIFVILLMGLFWKRSSEKAACYSMIFTAVVSVCWAGVRLVTGSYPIAGWLTETYASVIAAVASMLVLSLIYPNRGALRK